MHRFPGPDRRVREPEIMDDPALDGPRHLAALAGLARLNRLSRSGELLWSAIRRRAAAPAGRPLRVLDLASGGGDVALAVWRRARRAGVALEILGLDCSPRAVDDARRRAVAEKAPVEFAACDVLAEPLPAGFDVVASSLFFHHLSSEEAASLLTRMAAAAERLVLVNDLRRSAAGRFLAWFATRCFTSSDVVRTDGPRSARAAFALAEVRSLAEQAGLTGAVVTRRWPQRFLLEWVKP